MAINYNNNTEGRTYPKEELLCISYFDQIIGPSQFYCTEPLESEHPNLNKILEFNEKPGSFIFAFRKYQTVNHIFYVDSKFARGGQELLMISYLIRAAYFKNEIIDVFKYLESKKIILEQFAEDIKKLEDLPSILHNKNKNGLEGKLTELGSEEFKKKFLEMYENYLKMLSPRYEIEAPIQSNKKLKKIFIFGEKKSGKSTFLRNIEDIQFHNQINNDLPTRIYSLVIDNIEILTYDCIERNFECERCKNFGGCIKNAQAFILIFKPNDKNSIINAKDKFQKVLDACNDLENSKTPILIIENNFNNRQEFDSNYVYDFFNLEELKNCGMKIKYYSINVLKENKKIMKALHWLITHMI